MDTSQEANGKAAEGVTIYTVAAEAGVSISTVSLTLNGSERVKASTRERVLEVIDRLGFVPQATATSRARRAFTRIGVVAPFSSHESYQRRLVGVTTAFASDLTDVVVFDQYTAEASASPLLDTLPLTNRLDGLIIMGLPLGAQLTERLLSRERPVVVLVDSHSERFSQVNIDDARGGRLVAERLLEQGFSRFAWVKYPQRSLDYLSSGQIRGQAFLDTLAKAGVEREAIIELETTPGIDGGRAALRSLRAQTTEPIGVFAHEDMLAAGVVAECRRMGVPVPDEIAVIGYDDGPLADALDLTTIRQPFDTTGRQAANMLQQLLASPAHPQSQLTLDVQLIARASG